MIFRVFQDPLLGTCPSASIEQNLALAIQIANQVLTLTRKTVSEQGLTSLMVTHNMQHAIAFGNRLLMLHQGRIILDICGQAKAGLTVEDLVELFYKAQGEALSVDSMLLS